MEHSRFIGAFLGKLVNNIKSKIEFIVIDIFNTVNNAVFVKSGLDKLCINGIVKICKVNIGCARSFDFLNIFAHFGRAVGGNNDCVKFALLAADRYFVVRHGAVKINAVALVQSFRSVTDNHFQRAAGNNVYLLPVMANAVIGRIESFLRIRNGNSERLCNFIFEERCKAIVAETLAPCYGHTLALSCESIFRKARAAALHNIGYFNAADLRHLINKGKAEISAAGFIIAVFFFAYTDFLCHFRLSEAQVKAQSYNSLGNLHNFVFYRTLTKSYHFFDSPFASGTKKRPKAINFALRRVNLNPRYHSNCAERRLSTDSNKPYALTQRLRKLSTRQAAFGASARKG